MNNLSLLFMMWTFFMGCFSTRVAAIEQASDDNTVLSGISQIRHIVYVGLDRIYNRNTPLWSSCLFLIIFSLNRKFVTKRIDAKSTVTSHVVQNAVLGRGSLDIHISRTQQLNK